MLVMGMSCLAVGVEEERVVSTDSDSDAIVAVRSYCISTEANSQIMFLISMGNLLIRDDCVCFRSVLGGVRLM